MTNNNDSPPMGAVIRDRRRELHKTQIEVASRARCSLPHLQNLERGYLPARSDVLLRIIAALDEIERERTEAGS